MSKLNPLYWIYSAALWLIQLCCGLFFGHDHKPYTKKSKFQNLRGETIYYICDTCSHQKKETGFREYEGAGYK